MGEVEEVGRRVDAMVPTQPPVALEPPTDIPPSPPVPATESHSVRRSSRLRVPPDRWEPSFYSVLQVSRGDAICVNFCYCDCFLFTCQRLVLVA